VKQQSAVDQALLYLKNRQQKERPYFQELAKSVETFSKHQFTINTFRQLMTLVPDFYQHDWLNSQLTVSFASDSDDLADRFIQRNLRVKV
jgi:predicted component of type VI protein secretion system